MSLWLTIPNLLTLARLLLIPFVVRWVVHRQFTAAIAAFAVIAITDAADGILARRFGWITPVGAYLDPIADKLLLNSVYVALGMVGSVPWWLVVIVLGRDALILAGSGLAFLFTRWRRFPPSIWGKVSTFFQFLTGTACLVRHATLSPILAVVCEPLVWVTAVATIWSGIHYGWRGVHSVRTY